jgi:hypothetical protein
MMSNYQFDALRYSKSMATLYARMPLMTSSARAFALIAAELEAARELREAVEWERECDAFYKWCNGTGRGGWEWDNVVFAARAEVDLLLENTK